MARLSLPPTWILLLVSITLLLGPIPESRAQLSEFKFTRFVPSNTCAAMSLNMQAIFDRVDLDDRRLSQVLEAEIFGFDISGLDRILVIITTQSKDSDALGPAPMAVMMVFRDPVDEKEYFENHRMSTFVNFESETYNGQEIFEGRFKENYGGDNLGQAWYFPDEKTLIQGNRYVIRQMIDEESSMSDGMELVNNLDFEAELHFLLKGDQIPEEMSSAGLGLGLASDTFRDARRVEVVGSYEEQPPLRVTIEMNSEDSLNQVRGLINAGRIAAPGALDGFEQNAPHLVPAEMEESLRQLVALGRTSLRELQIQQDGNSLTITLENVDGLEELPHLIMVVVGSMILAQGA